MGVRVPETRVVTRLLPCGCYSYMNDPPASPSECEHCWHRQFDVTREATLHCGRCGAWKGLFD